MSGFFPDTWYIPLSVNLFLVTVLYTLFFEAVFAFCKYCGDIFLFLYVSQLSCI